LWSEGLKTSEADDLQQAQIIAMKAALLGQRFASCDYVQAALHI